MTTTAPDSAGYRRLLRDRSFVPYFLGESVSSVGDAMSEVAVVLVAMALVGDAAQGQAVSAAVIAYLLPGVLTGLLLGRQLRKASPAALLIIDSLWRFGWFALIGVLHSRDALSLPLLVGCLAAAALSKPAGQAGGRAIVPTLVAPGRLLHANSLLGIVVQGSMMVGPALAGLVAAVWDPVTALVVDGASFLLLAAGVLWSRQVARKAGHLPSRQTAEAGAVERLAEQDRRPASTRMAVVRSALPVFATTGLFHVLYGAFVVTLPLLAAASSPSDDGAVLLGVMWSSFGVGAILTGALAPRLPSLVRPSSLPLMALGWGLCMCWMAMVSHPALMSAAMCFGGLTYGPYTAVVATLFQRDLPAADLIEASGYYAVLTTSATPIGIMLTGLIASRLSPTAVMAGAGLLLTLTAACYAFALRGRQRLDEPGARFPAAHHTVGNQPSERR